MASPVGSVYVQLGIDTAEFKRGLKSAQDSAKVFAGAIDRAGRDFGQLQAQLNPAVAALREYERAQRTAATAVRLGAATQDQATAVLAQARARYESLTNVVDRGAGTFRNSGMAIQQAGFQVGDFAVQIASGQGVLRPFIQQGTQLISMFGPWGAVIGAAGAIVGALATSFMGATDASEDAQKEFDELASTSDNLGGSVDQLRGIVEEYAQALRDTAIASDQATSTIIANTRAEFAARQQLLRLDTFDDRQKKFQRDAEIETLRAREAEIRQSADPDRLLQEEMARERRPIEFGPNERVQERIAERATEAARQAQDISRQASRLEAVKVLADQQIEEADRLLSMTFEEVMAEVETTRSAKDARTSATRVPRKKGKTPSDVFGASIAEMRERLQMLDHERELIGRTEATQTRLTAAFERDRMVREILAKAEEEKINLTPQQIALVEEHAAAIETLTVANFALNQELDLQAKAAEEAKKKQEDLAKAITTVADRLISAVQQADSFTDALKNIGLELLKLSISGLGGEGPLGGLLGNIIPNLFGVGVSALAPATSPIPLARPPGFATGGIADGLAMVGERGRELINVGSPSRVFSNAETERMLGGGTVLNFTSNIDARGSTLTEGEFRGIARVEAQRAVGALKRANRHEAQFP